MPAKVGEDPQSQSHWMDTLTAYEREQIKVARAIMKDGTGGDKRHLWHMISRLADLLDSRQPPKTED